MGRQLVSRGSTPALPNFWDFPLSMTTLFKEQKEEQIGRGNM